MVEEEEGAEAIIKRGVVYPEEVGVATTRKAPPPNNIGEPRINDVINAHKTEIAMHLTEKKF